MEISEKAIKLLNFISEKFENNELSNNDLVENIKLSAAYLNLRTVSQYAKDENISYPGVFKRPNIQIIELFNMKFVIDNE